MAIKLCQKTFVVVGLLNSQKGRVCKKETYYLDSPFVNSNIVNILLCYCNNSIVGVCVIILLQTSTSFF